MSILKSSFTLRPPTSDLRTPKGKGVNHRDQPSPTSYLPYGANRLSLDGGIHIYFEALSQLSFNKKAVFCHPGRHYDQDGKQPIQQIKQEDFCKDEQDCGIGKREDNKGILVSNYNTLSRDDIEDDTSSEADMRDNVSPRKFKKKCLRDIRNDRDIMPSPDTNLFMARKHDTYSHENCSDKTSRRSLEYDLDRCKKRKASSYEENDVALAMQSRKLQETIR